MEPFQEKKFLDNFEWQKAIASPENTIRHIIEILNKTRLKAVYLVDKSSKLVGSITDGDIRRGFYEGRSLDEKSIIVANLKPVEGYEHEPFSVYSKRMKDNKISSIPIISSEKRLVFIHFDENSVPRLDKDNAVLIMAGGFGSRLGELTKETPKPMLHVAGKPIILHIIETFTMFGFQNFFISIYFKGEQIKNFLGDGRKFNVNIQYIEEGTPLGTAGSIGLIKDKITTNMLVANGDIFCDVNLDQFLEFHRKSRSDATMAVRNYEIANPFGTVDYVGTDLIGFNEKPLYKSVINAGFYILSPEALNFIKTGEPIDMPEVFLKLMKCQRKTSIFPIHENWHDVGRINDLIRIREIYQDQKT